jgi:hypothetical protein
MKLAIFILQLSRSCHFQTWVVILLHVGFVAYLSHHFVPPFSSRSDSSFALAGHGQSGMGINAAGELDGQLESQQGVKSRTLPH